MQTVYVDVLIFINIFINYFILLSAKSFLKINASYKRLILSSVIGGIFSIYALFPINSPIIDFIFKIVSACILVFCAFGKSKINQFIKRILTFLFISIGFCGIMILIFQIFKPQKMVISNNIVYFDISPIILILSTLICYFAIRLIHRITGKQEAKGHIYTIKATVNNIEYSFLGKTDTCCTLTEPFSGAPVIVAEKELFTKNSDFLINENSLRIIPFQSLGGKGIIKGFKPQKIAIDKKEIDTEIYLGICENIFNGEIKSIINSEIVEHINI